MRALELSILPEELAITRLDATAPVPAWAETGRLRSVTRAMDELSVVCDSQAVPEEAAHA